MLAKGAYNADRLVSTEVAAALIDMANLNSERGETKLQPIAIMALTQLVYVVVSDSKASIVQYIMESGLVNTLCSIISSTLADYSASTQQASITLLCFLFYEVKGLDFVAIRKYRSYLALESRLIPSLSKVISRSLGN